jgi:hypothetical protein
MELGVLAGIGTIAYLLSQDSKEKNFQDINNQSLQSHISNSPDLYKLTTDKNYATQKSCSESYPLYKPEYVRHQERSLENFSNKKINDKKENFNIYNIINTDGILNERMNNFVPANDSTLLNINDRPMTDFTHNNMVPFYGSKVKQNMAGTGVEQGNYIDGIDVNSGFDRTTPNQTLLASYTGIDDTYLHKREVGPLFSPAEQQTGWVYGSPNFRPDLDRYTQSLNNYRNDLSPVEPQMVGPGLNLDPTIPASGGFHDFTRILPNNVNDYKANQLSGQVIYGKYFSAGLPASYPGVGTSNDNRPPGVVKNRPNTYYDQVRYPTMTTKVGFVGNFEYLRPDYQSGLKPNNNLRDATSYGLGNLTYKEQQNNLIPCVDQDINIGQGPLAAHISQGPTRSETFMSQDNNIRSLSDCNSLPIGNPARPDFGQGNIIANYYVNETDRGNIYPTNLLPVQPSTNLGTFWTEQDEVRTTLKETLLVPFAGNTAREKDGSTFWTYTDEPKSSMKETTITPYVGNTSRERDGTTFWTYEDEPRTTINDTTQFSYTGNAVRPGEAMMNRTEFTGIYVEVDDTNDN